MRSKDSEQSSEKSDNMILNTMFPKLELPFFKGNLLESFYDQFKISIQPNETLNNIDRFDYLKRYLIRQASATLSGLTINSENYKEALEILIDTYRNPQGLMSALVETLVKINKSKNYGKFRSAAETL